MTWKSEQPLSTRRQSWNGLDDFFKQLKNNAKELCPDFPNVETCDPWDDLWAIKSYALGTDQANIDLHELIDVLRIKAELTKEQVINLQSGMLQL